MIFFQFKDKVPAGLIGKNSKISINNTSHAKINIKFLQHLKVNKNKMYEI